MSGQAVGGKEFELLFEKQFSLLLIAAMQANVACNRKSQIAAHGATTTSSAFSCDSQLSGNGEAEKLPTSTLSGPLLMGQKRRSRLTGTAAPHTAIVLRCLLPDSCKASVYGR